MASLDLCFWFSLVFDSAQQEEAMPPEPKPSLHCARVRVETQGVNLQIRWGGVFQEQPFSSA